MIHNYFFLSVIEIIIEYVSLTTMHYELRIIETEVNYG
jgi:hypothetical protein